MPGIGKTDTALKFVDQFQNNYDFIFWIRSETLDSIESSFLQIADEMDLSEKNNSNSAKKLIKESLESNKKWLLVLDNVGNTNLIKEFLPFFKSKEGHILITTTNTFSNIAKSLELPKMDFIDGPSFILSRARGINNETPFEKEDILSQNAAREIYKLVDGLPLALDQAGAYISETSISAQDYLKLYQTFGAKLRNERGNSLSEHLHPVTVTFKLAFEQITNKASIDILKICAFLSPNEIPEEIFQQKSTSLSPHLDILSLDEFSFNNAIKQINRFSLIKRNTNKKTLQIHQVVQDVIRDSLDEDKSTKSWLEKTISILLNLFPPDEYIYWDKTERLIRHVITCFKLIKKYDVISEESALLLNQAGIYLFRRGIDTLAEDLYKLSAHLWRTLLGNHNQGLATSLNNLAALYCMQNNAAKAQVVVKEALTIREKLLSPNDPTLAKTFCNYGHVLILQKKFDEAENFFNKAKNIFEQMPEAFEADLSIIYSNLAVVYFRQQYHQKEKAKSYFSKALSIINKAKLSNYPYLIPILNNIADLHYELGEYKIATPLYELCLSIAKLLLGIHPDTIELYNKVGELYALQMLYKEAIANYLLSLEISLQLYGKHHYSVASILNEIGNIYISLGKFSIAKNYLEKAEESLDLDSPKFNNISAKVHSSKGRLYFELSYFEKAEEFYTKSVSLFENLYGLNSKEILPIMHNLAHLYLEQHNYSTAKELYKKLYFLTLKYYSPTHVEIGIILQNLAMVSVLQEQKKGVEKMYFDAITIFENALGKNHWFLSRTYLNLAYFYYYENNIKKSKQFLDKSLDLFNFNQKPIFYSQIQPLDRAIELYLLLQDLPISPTSHSTIKFGFSKLLYNIRLTLKDLAR